MGGSKSYSFVSKILWRFEMKQVRMLSVTSNIAITDKWLIDVIFISSPCDYEIPVFGSLLETKKKTPAFVLIPYLYLGFEFEKPDRKYKKSKKSVSSAFVTPSEIYYGLVSWRWNALLLGELTPNPSGGHRSKPSTLWTEEGQWHRQGIEPPLIDVLYPHHTHTHTHTRTRTRTITITRQFDLCTDYCFF